MKSFQRFLSVLVLSVLFPAFIGVARAQSADNHSATSPQVARSASENRFEKNVLAYEAADKTNPPPKNAILLVGDSQFYRWKTLYEDLPDYTIINRGIDSFQTSDLVYFAGRLVLPYQPRMIILHVGGNDVHNGKSPAQILEDFKEFVAKVRVSLPDVPIAFSSITPGPGRWDEAEKRKQTNTAIKDYIATQPHLLFIDLWDAMLTPDGKPREDLWVADRIHPNHAGYLLRVKIMRPILGSPDKESK
ncbi:MAG TPA: GDSL-type esterase/lipase family protein [Verrucomicrobiae bacterium]|nr:GDSL-type esterase/lipase family protein [Verrucomicrobiae bacterium]